LRASAEFKAVFGEGKRISGSYFRLHVRLWTGIEGEALAPERSPARLGLAVSKRVDKTAVGRNRLRRQAKESFRWLRQSLPPGDYVVLATPAAARTENAVLRAELLSLFTRARTLKPMAANGTMPPAAATADPSPTVS
jgi:ribonuclease P protein component